MVKGLKAGADPKESFIPKTRVETWRREAYERASRAERVKLSEWMRRALDRAAGIEASPAPQPAHQPRSETPADWADIDFD